MLFDLHSINCYYVCDFPTGIVRRKSMYLATSAQHCAPASTSGSVLSNSDIFTRESPHAHFKLH